MVTSKKQYQTDQDDMQRKYETILLTELSHSIACKKFRLKVLHYFQELFTIGAETNSSRIQKHRNRVLSLPDGCRFLEIANVGLPYVRDKSVLF